jgi:hypothetical protein
MKREKKKKKNPAKIHITDIKIETMMQRTREKIKDSQPRNQENQ